MKLDRNHVKSLFKKRLNRLAYNNAISDIQEYVTQLESDLQNTRDNFATFSETEKIKKLKEEIAYLQKHSLQHLTDLELELDEEFRNIHYKKEGCRNSNDFSYRLVGTGIGTSIEITCNHCGESRDITDIESW